MGRWIYDEYKFQIFCIMIWYLMMFGGIVYIIHNLNFVNR